MLLNYADYRHAARHFLPKGLFEYIDRGTEDEQALEHLRHSFDALRITPRILMGHKQRDLSVTLFERCQDTPLIVAPTALAGIVSYQGEQKLARAATAVGIPFCAATQSVESIDDIAAHAPDADLWFQLYFWKNRALSQALLDRAWGVGVRNLLVTADTPVSPKREYNQRNHFGVPFSLTLRNALDMALHPRWLVSVALPYLARGGMPTYGNYPPKFRSTITRTRIATDVMLDHALTWDDLTRLRDSWPGRVIVKGIMAANDAVTAQRLGMDGIVVSAHGGRNLDMVPSPLQVLSSIRTAVGADLPIIADSGIRRGSDVVKYLHQGADAVMLGRLPLWGLAVGGERSATACLNMLRQEIDLAMTFLGVRDLSDLRRLPASIDFTRSTAFNKSHIPQL